MSSILRNFKLSKSGYYEYLKRKPCKTKIRKENITKEIIEIHNDSYEIYGAPKITQILKCNGHIISERYVSNIMHENGIKACYIKPYTVTTKNCDFSNKLKNVLDRKFDPDKPNAVWCTDITYIWTYEDEFVYLTSIMDLYSRKIIAWTLSKTMEVDEVLKCLEQAKQRRQTDDPIVIQSDRGSQFVSKRYQELTSDMITSYSRKGTPWDNASIESFHSLIKREWINRQKIYDYNHAYRLLFEYINGFYNTVRIHEHCDYQSPLNYEKEFNEVLKN